MFQGEVLDRFSVRTGDKVVMPTAAGPVASALIKMTGFSDHAFVKRDDCEITARIRRRRSRENKCLLIAFWSGSDPTPRWHIGAMIALSHAGREIPVDFISTRELLKLSGFELP